MDMQTLGFVVGAVVIVAITLYVMDRKSKGTPVDWMDVTKIAVGAGAVTGGVVYTIGTDAVSDVVETATTAAQDMFVGKPGF